jgi:outer membrane protein, multidrug efflux system
MVGPNYRRSRVDVPRAWRLDDKEARDVANTAWWEQFNDPALNELIHIALGDNKDLKIATARVERFVGQMETSRAPLFLQIGAGGLAGRERKSELTGSNLLLGVSTSNPTFDIYRIFLNASFGGRLLGKGEASHRSGTRQSAEYRGGA